MLDSEKFDLEFDRQMKVAKIFTLFFLVAAPILLGVLIWAIIRVVMHFT